MQLTTIEEKLHRLQHLSVDHVVVAPFDAECSTREGSSFLRELRDLHPLEIWGGPGAASARSSYKIDTFKRNSC
ncbi:hypothetical protein [Brevibacillus choshinensis]|uniref:hypothetical protein n=1 Tax=Brevibacillus choshinensis TaxID=54911 RepID=UPI002E1F82BF|nr:hypothetical protein [Brevibacillus choshinensis]